MSTAALRLPSKSLAIVVMGVTGCGKTTIGQALAEELCAAFIEGDALHPPANIAKMSAGTPLNDIDRLPWLKAIGAEIGRLHGSGHAVVAACSALKHSYRDTLRQESGCDIVFVMLDGTRDFIASRLSARQGHFMPPSLLDSQFAALEPLSANERSIHVDLARPAEDILTDVMAGLSHHRV